MNKTMNKKHEDYITHIKNKEDEKKLQRNC